MGCNNLCCGPFYILAISIKYARIMKVKAKNQSFIFKKRNGRKYKSRAEAKREFN